MFSLFWRNTYERYSEHLISVSIFIFSDQQLNLIEEGLDLAVRIADLKDSSLIARKLSAIKIQLCASPNYLKKQGTPQTVDELNHHQLLHYNLSNPSTWKLTDKLGKQHFIHIKAKMQANNGDFLKDMAIAGHGIVMLPNFISWKAIASGKLVLILTDYSSPELNAYAIYPQTRYLSQRTRVLINFLVQRFGNKPYWDNS